MNPWNETPLFRFLIIFIAGILLAVYYPIVNSAVAIWTCILLIAIFLLLYIFRRKLYSYKIRWVTGLVSVLITFLAGYVLTFLNSEKDYPVHFRNHQQAEAFVCVVDEPLVRKTGSFKTILKIMAVRENDEWKTATGNCLAYFDKTEKSASLNYGDRIMLKQIPAEVRPPGNPSQFDYKRWLGFNKVFDQVFIRAEDWKLLDSHHGSRLHEFSYSLREKLLDVFRQNHIVGQEYAVLSALILGKDDEIDQDVISAYAASGALHVLSVSGLHVGIIYVALSFILGFLERSRKARVMKSVILILFLWFYALLTGLSPSVLRSATMLSFIVIGKMARQYTNMYNTLAASAFFLLGLNPFLIMQVGFQLSYCAVLGILFLQPLIYGWIDVPNWFLRQVWSITSVSLAAQVATFPLGLFYFHQFPNYFLISNIIIIPVSTVIIYGGILLLVFSWWNYASLLIGICLGGIVRTMNWIVLLIEELPFSLLGGISITVIETGFIYASIFAIILFLMSRRPAYLVFSTFAFLCLMASQVVESAAHRKQKQLVIYHIKGKSFLNLIDGRENLVLADSGTLANPTLMLFNVYQYWWECGFMENNFTVVNDSLMPEFKIPAGENFIQFGNKKIVRVDDSTMLNRTIGKLDVDFLILSANVKIKIATLTRHFNFKKLIIDSSNSLSRAKKWMEEAKQLKIPVHSVIHQGAFLANLKD